MAPANRNLAMGLVVSAVAIFLSLFLAEIGMRIFTQFPISYRTNRLHDASLGYRLNPGLGDVDQGGFRNPETNVPAEIIAVGNSFTFGNNVASENSWPALLSSRTGRKVYNTGVGSYGIASYHAILTQFLLENPERKALVAIHPGNDFLPVNSFCEIEFDGEFWAKEERRIGTEFAALQTACEQKDNVEMNWEKWVVGNIAIASAIDQLIMPQFSKHARVQSLPAGLPEVDLRQGAANERVRNAEPLFMKQCERIFADWGTAWKGRISIVIIPSKQRVFYEVLAQKGALSETPPELVRRAENEIKLEDFVRAQALLNDIPLESALADIVQIVDRDLYPVFDGHPHERGYVAFTQAAERALGRISN